MLNFIMLLPNGCKWDKVPISIIQYVICDKRLRKQVTIGREYRLSFSLEAIEAQLPEQEFVRTRKSCIVSVSNISSIGKSELTVAGRSLPVARRVRPGFMPVRRMIAEEKNELDEWLHESAAKSESTPFVISNRG